MKSLPSYSPRVVSGNRSVGGFFSPESLLSRPDARFVAHKRVSSVRFLQSVPPLNPMAIPPISTSSICSPISQANLDAAETQTEDSYQSKTVHVRFKLQKECVFGEQFLIVGDDPIFGLWDPSCAIPLDWSDGHMWTAEMDIPIGKSIQFKFLLKDRSGNISWQPGPNRICLTWDTKNIITIVEDWENPEFQNIVEGEPVPAGDEESKSDPLTIDKATTDTREELIVQEDVSHLQENPSVNLNKVDPVIDQTMDVLIEENINGTTNGRAAAVVRSKVSYDGDPVLVPGLTPLSTVSTEGAPTVKEENTTHIENPIEADSLSSVASAEIAVLDKDKKSPYTNNAPNGADKFKDHEVPKEESPEMNFNANIQNDGERGHQPTMSEEKEQNIVEVNEESPAMNFNADIQHDGERGHQLTISEEKEQNIVEVNEESPAMNFNADIQHDREQEEEKSVESNEDHVLSSDIAWGRRTFQKFLSDLGLI